MKPRMTSVIAACAIAGFTGPAVAGCEQELSELRDQMQAETAGGISKDGSLAPLEGANEKTDRNAGAAGSTASSGTVSGSDQSNTTENDNQIVKDGDLVPLDTDLTGVATSGQQAEAQQQDTSGSAGKTASAEMSQETRDALNVADAALKAGDEAACMEAVKEARSTL